VSLLTTALRARRLPRWQDFGGNARVVRRALNVWPPFAFAGVRVEHLSDDFRHARVRLGFHPLTRNYVGTQFGGSMFSMTDPFWMVMVLRALGERDYVVWDKAGEIEFVAPGRSTVRAEFVVTDEMLDELRAATEAGGKTLRWFETEVTDVDGTVVARVRKQLYVRRRPQAAAAAAPSPTDEDDDG
jgi:acyl-coenzyme A thioesterase PaaI-like protein